MSSRAESGTTRNSSKYNKREQAIYSLILTLNAILIIFSTILPWDTYITTDTLFLWKLTGIFLPIVKTFTPLTWIFSSILPFLSYLPLLSGILILIGLIFYRIEYTYGKKVIIVGIVLAILIYALYPIFFNVLVPYVVRKTGGAFFGYLEGLRIPNEFGAYFCLLPAIGSIPFTALLQLSEIEVEPLALKESKVAIPYKKVKVANGEKFCSNCGAIIVEGAAFCNQCGTYF